MKLCLGLSDRPCNEVAYEGSRCKWCQKEWNRRRNALRDQYHGAWRAASRKARAGATNCARCGVALVKSNRSPRGATLDHETGTVECRSCNSSHRREPRWEQLELFK